MAEERVKLIGRLYEAFGKGDMDVIANLLADTDWTEAEGMPYGGRYRGASEIFKKIFGPIAAEVKDFSARPDELLPAGDDRVLALGRYKGKGAKGDLDAAFAHVWTVKDSNIVKFVQYADTHLFRQAVCP